MKYLLILAILFISEALYAGQAPVVVINTDTATTQISSTNLLRIYTMQKKRWPNGKKIQVYILPQLDKTHQAFVKKILKSQPYQLERHWKRLLFSGVGKTPIVLKNEQEMLDKIANNPGAVGYVNSQWVTDSSVILVVK